MRLAIFSDVHGNLPALDGFLCAVQGKVDGYICLGDVVNYGPWSNECVDVVIALPNAVWLQGNHERLFLGLEDITSELPIVQEFFRFAHDGFTRTADLTRFRPSYIVGRFTFVHTVDGQKIFKDSHIETDRDYVFGHSHHQFRIRRGERELINCGSVGQNREFIDAANYAIFDTETQEVALCTAPYDFEEMIDEMKKRGYSSACLDYYLTKPRLYSR